MEHRQGKATLTVDLRELGSCICFMLMSSDIDRTLATVGLDAADAWIGGSLPPLINSGEDRMAGTRAGKPFYVRTDEAILTPDWVPNECIVCVYNAADREFYWSNLAYASCCKSYGSWSMLLREVRKGHLHS